MDDVELPDEESRPDDVLDQRKAFDEERRKGIFSTDVAAILGLSRYGTALSVYRAKRGEDEQRKTSLAAWMGSTLENVVAELYMTATGLRVRADNLAHFHPKYDWLGAHLDRRVVKDPALIVELKTRNSTRGWGDDGTADIPPDVWCQVQTQMFVVGARECHVATLFSNSAYRTYKIDPDRDFIEKLLPTLEEFWFNNVVAGVPPIPTGHDVDSDIVKRIAGEGEGGALKPATPEHVAIVDQYRIARYNAAQAKFAAEGLKNRIIQLIGPDSDGLMGPFGVITYKRTKPVHHVAWELVAGTYRRAAERLLELSNPNDDEDLVAELAMIEGQVTAAETLYAETRPGSRRFLVDFVEQ